MKRLLLPALMLALMDSGARGEDKPAVRLLPGLQPGGEIRLPNQWSLRPAGRQVQLGDLPVNLALHPGGEWLAVLHAGYSEHEISILNLKGPRVQTTCRVTVPQAFYGLCFSPDGSSLFASGGEFEVVHRFQFDKGLLAKQEKIRVANIADTFITSGIALDKQGKTLFATGLFGHAVAMVPLDVPDQRQTVALEPDSYPYACLPEPGGKHLYVSLWRKAAIAVIDIAERKVAATWPTESHPTEMVLSPNGKTLFVACANSTRVSVIDTQTGKPLETIHCALYPSTLSGNTPNSLSLTPDGQLLFVANADNNNLAVINVSKPGSSQALGFIPVGWYPTSVRYNPADKKIYVANGKGLTSRANPQGPGSNPRLAPLYQYIGALLKGTLSISTLPSPRTWSLTPSRPTPAARSGLMGSPSANESRTIPSRGRSAHPARSSTAFTSSRRTAPTTRSLAISRRAMAIPTCVCLARKLLPTITSWCASLSCWTISIATARCRRTATSGVWQLMPRISWRKCGL